MNASSTAARSGPFPSSRARTASRSFSAGSNLSVRGSRPLRRNSCSNSLALDPMRPSDTDGATTALASISNSVDAARVKLRLPQGRSRLHKSRWRSPTDRRHRRWPARQQRREPSQESPQALDAALVNDASRLAAAHSRPLPKRLLTSAVRSCQPAKAYPRAITSRASCCVHALVHGGQVRRCPRHGPGIAAGDVAGGFFACCGGIRGTDEPETFVVAIASSFHEPPGPPPKPGRRRCERRRHRAKTGGSVPLPRLGPVLSARYWAVSRGWPLRCQWNAADALCGCTARAVGQRLGCDGSCPWYISLRNTLGIPGRCHVLQGQPQRGEARPCRHRFSLLRPCR